MKGIDPWLLGVVIALTVMGVFIFFSASLGLLARNGAQFSGIFINQLVSLFLGGLLFLCALRIPYRFFHRYSFYIFLATLFLTALVFVPGLGAAHGGAERWIFIGPFSLQPSEFLKLGFVFYFAAWLTAVKTHVQSFSLGLIPLVAMMFLVGLILLKQPDTGTFAVILGTALAMFIVGGAPWGYIGALCAAALSGILLLGAFRPYVRDRLLVFLNPAMDPHGAGYQIQQSLLAVGSGQFFGRGFGQSIQKFNFLPEPIGDSIFAVFAEEFGFLGGTVLVSLFVFFAFRGLFLAKHAPDYFSRLTIVGIVILITGQAFLNIGSMVGVLPLTGLPLPFISHGGTALMTTLFAVGVVLNISRHSTRH